MPGETETKDIRCCPTEHDRLVVELDTCDQLYTNPSEWHHCARVIARRSGRRAKQCLFQG